MKTVQWSLMLSAIVIVCLGCDTLRFAPTESQKQNAFVHWRTADLAAQQAADENASPQMSALTALSSQQSRAFVADYGLPSELPNADTADDILTIAPNIAQRAYQESTARPDIWQAADGLMELAIALAGLFGGAAGIRITQYLKQAREKSTALKEIIKGNELFKRDYPAQADAFKSTQSGQSTATRKLVAEQKLP